MTVTKHTKLENLAEQRAGNNIKLVELRGNLSLPAKWALPLPVKKDFFLSDSLLQDVFPASQTAPQPSNNDAYQKKHKKMCVTKQPRVGP